MRCYFCLCSCGLPAAIVYHWHCCAGSAQAARRQGSATVTFKLTHRAAAATARLQKNGVVAVNIPLHQLAAGTSIKHQVASPSNKYRRRRRGHNHRGRACSRWRQQVVAHRTGQPAAAHHTGQAAAVRRTGQAAVGRRMGQTAAVRHTGQVGARPIDYQVRQRRLQQHPHHRRRRPGAGNQLSDDPARHTQSRARRHHHRRRQVHRVHPRMSVVAGQRRRRVC